MTELAKHKPVGLLRQTVREAANPEWRATVSGENELKELLNGIDRSDREALNKLHAGLKSLNQAEIKLLETRLSKTEPSDAERLSHSSKRASKKSVLVDQRQAA